MTDDGVYLIIILLSPKRMTDLGHFFDQISKLVRGFKEFSFSFRQSVP
jgi:hypothetical protein